MPKHLIIRNEVFAEIEDACDWYEERDPALPPRFVEALRQTLETIQLQPQ